MTKLLAFAIIALQLITAGCASTAPENLSLASTQFNASNAGLVTGRSLAHQGDQWVGWKGLALWFRNVDTDQIFKTAGGVGGYTASEYFAIWLPEGRYALAGVFSYGTVLIPSETPLRFDVKNGEAIYVGTITHSWEARKDLDKMGELVRIRRYGELKCGLTCTVGAKDNVTLANRIAEVGIFDEGKQFVTAIKAECPALPAMTIQQALLY